MLFYKMFGDRVDVSILDANILLFVIKFHIENFKILECTDSIIVAIVVRDVLNTGND